MGRPTQPDEDVLPSVISVGAIDWRFADPAADALVSTSFSNLAPSPLAHFRDVSIRSQSRLEGSGHGEDDARLRRRTAGGDLDARQSDPHPGNRPLAGSEPARARSRLEGRAPAAQVDLAIERLNKDVPLPELARTATRLANGDLWAASNGNAPGLKKVSVFASMRSRPTSDSVFEFVQPPDGNAIAALASGPGLVSVQGSTVHVKMSLDAENVQANVPDLATAPLGEYIGVLFRARRYILAGDPAKSQPKPKIAGLDPN